MSPEQTKVRKIYTDLSHQGFTFVGCWIGIGVFCLWHVFCFIVPIQLLLLEPAGSSDYHLTFWMTITGIMIGHLRIQPFESHTENQKTRKFSEILKYYPIDRKEVKKMKLFYVARIMAKVSVASLVVQLWWAYTEASVHGISWMNFVYVFMLSFVVPVVGNAIYIHFEK